jgi:phosphatidate cytidylyltransferase
LDKNLLLRSISGFVYVLVVLFCTHPIGAELLNSISPYEIPQQYLYFSLIVFLAFFGAKECVGIMKFGNGYEKWIVFPLIAFVFYTYSKRFFHHDFYFNYRINEILAIALIIIAVVTLFKFTSELYADGGKLIFTVIYVALPFGFALGLPKYSTIDNSFSLEVFFLFVLIWSSDTFAYICGRLFGKHKMAPKISPKKTWEGLIGGVICTVVLGYFVEMYHPNLRGNWMVVGFLVSIFAPFGDLVESQLKRSFGVKDSGNIIPGHGGILDRLDSFIICVPAIYLYFILDKII